MPDNVDQNIDEVAFQKNIHTVLHTLPKALQDFLTSEERDVVALHISSRYSLHVDQAGSFQRAYLLMLMGLLTPAEFVGSLESAGISSETIKSLTNDVNEMVFKPLREKERIGDRKSVV